MRDPLTTPPNNTAPGDGGDGSMAYFPVFLKLADEDVLVLGGSDGAAAKVRLLLRSGARVRLFARALGREMVELVRADRLRVLEAPLGLEGMAGCRLAFDDGEDPAATALLRLHAPTLGLWVNTIDQPTSCDFIVPAIVDRSPVIVAISTGGGSPALAKLVRQRIEAILPSGLGRLTRALSACRDGVKAALPEARSRLRFWDAFLTDDRLDRLSAAKGATVAAEVAEALSDGPLMDASFGSVTLVGAGPGDPGLLTLAAAQALRTADVILHDALVSRDILDMSRKEARLISVGKRAGGAAMPQDMINRLIVTHAKRGARVVRLKGGDPFIFGRGGEEQAHLLAHGIRPRIIGGTTAALGVAANLGIPLTHRGEARSLRLITGTLGTSHQGDGRSDWATLADPETTLCLYMAGRQVSDAARGLMEGGLPSTTPVAAVWSGCTAEQEHRFLTLEELTQWSGDPRGGRPVLFIVGRVVAQSPLFHSMPMTEGRALFAF